MSELTIKDFRSKYEPIGLSMELKSQGQSAYETGKIGGHTPLYTDEQIQDYLSNQPQLTIPESIADELEEEIEEAYSNDYIRSYSDVGAYMEVITDGLDEDSELYKFMFPDDALLGCSHRNIIYLYLVDDDLVKVV
ncbi:hypothetical protein CYU10_002319 [Lactococcus lactis subsp. lactis]|uniref:Uncharacterized protein n=2 Tax=Lactococcus lactis TaxID=1358 RepID=A0A2N5W9L4_LACLL|nr:hypothetical protein CYU10_002319 [Lactococcus lactis subsp. lactis]